MNLDELKQAKDAATVAVNEAMNRMNKAAIDAATRVRANHAAEIAALTKTATDARVAYDEALSAAASHPWEGKAVFKMEKVSRWGAEKRIDGVVRVRRVGEFPGGANQRYRLPGIGQAYVLATKRDGSPGVRVLSLLLKPDRTDGWALALALAEGETA